ncbi:hypothetical protein [Novosphingobium lentum]|uniref:hypothetical protein n=1 Tax=Novosphingobium lentum TaxID=145287 RepID=UPI00083019E1|nr:hypothetical protein [Novosphingobium lentum]
MPRFSRLYPMSLRLALLAAMVMPGGCARDTASGLAAFERALAANDSATAALGAWCAAHAIASPPVIAAQAIAGPPPPVPHEVRQLLSIAPLEPVRYRHVRLACGSTVLSVAHNWYVPARLTPDMNRLLDTTDTPFGKVVAPLGFRRERLASRHGGDRGCPGGTVLAHRAVLRLADGTAISVVIECYTRANVGRRR